MKLSPLSALWINVLVNAFMPVFAFWGAGKINPFFFAFAGSLTAFLFLLPFIYGRGYLTKFLEKENRISLFIVGFCGSVLPVILLVFALKYTTPSNAAIIGQVEVVYSLILSSVFLRERATYKQLAGTVMVLAGTMIIILRERFTLRFAGDLTVLFIPLCYQISHLFSKKLKNPVSPLFMASARTFFAAISSFAVIILYSGLSGYRPSLDFTGLLVIIGWGVFLTALNNILWYRAILNMDLAKATAIILSYPVFTTLISAVLGLEKIKFYQAAGLATAIAGALIVTSVVKKDSVSAAGW